MAYTSFEVDYCSLKPWLQHHKPNVDMRGGGGGEHYQINCVYSASFAITTPENMLQSIEISVRVNRLVLSNRCCERQITICIPEQRFTCRTSCRDARQHNV